MTATLDDVDTLTLPDTSDVKQCQCRRYQVSTRTLEPCLNPAAWLYVMKCCGYQTFVCEHHHQKHLNAPTEKYRCTHCQTEVINHVSELIGRMIQL